jgi:hypothetical protein
MLQTIALRAAVFHRALRRIWKWACRHPRWSVVIVMVVWYVASLIFNGALALADNGSVSSLPFLPPTEMKDTHGVSMVHYVTLPLDRGDAWTFGKTFWTSITDAIWIAHITALTWMLWQFEFLLSFQWVSWLASPIDVIAKLVHNVVSAIGWIPLALAIAALVCGIAFWTGRMAKSLVEVGVSVAAAVLAVTILANPVATLTGPNGAFSFVEKWGGSIAVSIAGGDDQLSNQDPSTTDSSKILTDTITAQLMDLFVRLPAQEIAFGHDLTGKCDDVFTAQMKADNPIDTSSTTVRDAVGQCDPSAQDYVTHSGPVQTITAAVVSTGSFTLTMLGEGLALVLMLTVLGALWQALKLIAAVNAAVLPGVARQSFWRSLIGMYVAVLCVGLTVILLSGYLRLIVDAMTAASKALGHTDVVAELLFIDMTVIVLIIGLFYIRHRAKKAGEKVADRLARLGFGGPREKHPNKALESARRVGESYLATHLRKPTRSPKQLTPAASKQPAELGYLPSATATRRPGDTLGEITAGGKSGGPNGTPGGNLLAIGSKAGSLVSTGAQLAAAASTGGTSAVVMSASKMAGKTVLQRAVAHGTEKIANGRPMPTFTGFGRQIVVDGEGKSAIAPAKAPERKSVYDVTSMPRRAPSIAASSLRRQLTSAAVGKR